MTSVPTLACIFLLFCLNSSSDGLWMSKFGGKRNPVILLPGLGGSPLEVRVDWEKVPQVPNSFCKTLPKTWFQIWIDVNQLQPVLMDCLTSILKTHYNSTTHKSFNVPGVELRPKGWGDTKSVESMVKHVSMGLYMTQLIFALNAVGYRRNIDIRGAPYDFRKSPTDNDEFHEDFRRLVEETSRQNSYRQVILVGHSLGGSYALSFLIRQSQEWKDKYVKSVITLGTPYSGSSRAINALMSGTIVENVVPFEMTRTKHFLDNIKTFSVIPYLLPSPVAYDDTKPLIKFSKSSNGEKNIITTANYEMLFNMTNNGVGYEIFEDMKKERNELIHPGVNVVCIHGSGVPSAESFVFSGSDMSNVPVVNHVSGDGVNTERSLSACEKYRQMKESLKFHFKRKNFYMVEHVNMIYDPLVISYVIRQIMSG